MVVDEPETPDLKQAQVGACRLPHFALQRRHRAVGLTSKRTENHLSLSRPVSLLVLPGSDRS